MTDQIVITEKSSQAKDVRAAVGSRYGAVLPAEGHLLDLCEPEDVNPAWKRWAAVLLKPQGLYGTKPAPGGNKAAKLKAIREALRTAKRVWLATDCDREGQLIGQEILEHCGYRGEVLRVLFTAQDAQTIREAFGRARPNGEHARLYAAAVARRQADQIYNLSLTRTATVTVGRGASGVVGVGRVKTPTLAIACKRELEIRDFVPGSYFEVVALMHPLITAGRQMPKTSIHALFQPFPNVSINANPVIELGYAASAPAGTTSASAASGAHHIRYARPPHPAPTAPQSRLTNSRRSPLRAASIRPIPRMSLMSRNPASIPQRLP